MGIRWENARLAKAHLTGRNHFTHMWWVPHKSKYMRRRYWKCVRRAVWDEHQQHRLRMLSSRVNWKDW